MIEEGEYRRCKAIKDLIDSPMFHVAVEDIKDDIKEELVSMPIADVDKRNSLHLEYSLLERLIGRLTIYANKASMERKYG